MRGFIILFVFLITFLNCFQKEKLYFTHLYGWVKYDTTAINGIILRVRDINPEDPTHFRFRADTTGYSPDSLLGFFEMDSVCYATSEFQGSRIVAVLVDSLENPGWPSQYWYLDLSGGIDTVELHLIKQE